MATALQIALTEYLHTIYEPDCDYVNGDIEERDVGQLEHSVSQNFFALQVGLHKSEWRLQALPEIRMQVSPTRIRVADIAVRSMDEPYEPVLTRPPLAVIEVLLPEDRISRYREKLEDYRDFGIPAIWVVDPQRRGAFECRSGSWTPIDDFCIPGTNYRIPVSDLWADLDALHHA